MRNDGGSGNKGGIPEKAGTNRRALFRYFVFYTMIAEKPSTPVLKTRYVPATMVLTITSAAAVENSSIEDSEGDSLNKKTGRQYGFGYRQIESPEAA